MLIGFIEGFKLGGIWVVRVLKVCESVCNLSKMILVGVGMELAETHLKLFSIVDFFFFFFFFFFCVWCFS